MIARSSLFHSIAVLLALSTIESFVHNPFIQGLTGLTITSVSTPLGSNRVSLERKASETEICTVTVALTREEGKNDKIRKSIENHPTKKMLENSLKLNVIDMPCIGHADGPDLETFQTIAKENPSFSNYDYIIITSPESAKVFGESVHEPNELSATIAAVGKATQKSLTDQGFIVGFVPSKANGETLAEELPPVDDTRLNNVLYPSSAKAADTIKDNLESRKDASFCVNRLDTYDTVPIQFTKKQLDCAIDDVQIACFGSPSAVDAWLQNVDRALGIEDLDEEARKKTPGSQGNVVAVCIGGTTAKRCLESGRWVSSDIYYSSHNPGLEGWTDSCYSASSDVMERMFWGGDGW